LGEDIYVNKNFIEFADGGKLTGRIRTTDIKSIYYGTIFPEIYLK